MDGVDLFRQSLGRVSAEIVYPHVFDEVDRESGGLLIGTAQRDGSLPEVITALEGRHALEEVGSLTFTQQTWEDLLSRFDRLAAGSERGLEIVGWYHSHPRSSAYLSERDLFIHKSFFPSSFQVAQVVDLRGRCEGVFSWSGEEIGLLFEREIGSDSV